MYERSKLRPSKSYLGVWYHTEIKKWRTQVRRNGVLRVIGHYDTEREAGLAFNSAVRAGDKSIGGLETYGFYCEAPGGVVLEISTMKIAEPV
jgi:hypothetical protein